MSWDDALYAELMAAHAGLDAAASADLDRRLVLLLGAALGDAARLRTAIDAARASCAEPLSPAPRAP